MPQGVERVESKLGVLLPVNQPTGGYMRGEIDGLDICMNSVREFRDCLMSVHESSLMENYWLKFNAVEEEEGE